jgi:hypothetical protein
MTEDTTLTVIDSKDGHIPEGTTLRVEDSHTNQFTGRTVLTVLPTPTPEDRVEGSTIQVYQMPDSTKDVYTEIVVYRESDTITVKRNN